METQAAHEPRRRWAAALRGCVGTLLVFPCVAAFAGSGVLWSISSRSAIERVTIVDAAGVARETALPVLEDGASASRGVRVRPGSRAVVSLPSPRSGFRLLLQSAAQAPLVVRDPERGTTLWRVAPDPSREGLLTRESPPLASDAKLESFAIVAGAQPSALAGLAIERSWLRLSPRGVALLLVVGFLAVAALARSAGGLGGGARAILRAWHALDAPLGALLVYAVFFRFPAGATGFIGAALAIGALVYGLTRALPAVLLRSGTAQARQ